jgi:hypothetical protein
MQQYTVNTHIFLNKENNFKKLNISRNSNLKKLDIQSGASTRLTRWV